MAFTYKTVVPWGRSYEEYVRMFGLTSDDLEARILGCGDGPASFNSEMNKRGCNVISIDPIYQFEAGEIAKRIEETYDEVISQTYREKDKFLWHTISSVEELGLIRMAAMQEFICDYEEGRRQGRYIAANLPTLPFKAHNFDLALCSHFLFLYTAKLSLGFHRSAVAEMCRVAKDVRIFPLVDLDGDVSPYVEVVSKEFENSGMTVEIKNVPYEFQRGGNKLLSIRTA